MAAHASIRRPGRRPSGLSLHPGSVICEPLECRRLMARGDPDSAFGGGDRRSFDAIIKGEADDLPEQAFLYVGNIEDVRARAKEMA